MNTNIILLQRYFQSLSISSHPGLQSLSLSAVSALFSARFSLSPSPAASFSPTAPILSLMSSPTLSFSLSNPLSSCYSLMISIPFTTLSPHTVQSSFFLLSPYLTYLTYVGVTVVYDTVLQCAVLYRIVLYSIVVYCTNCSVLY